MKKATITITPENPDKFLNCETGDVSKFEILQALKILQAHFANAVIEEYKHLSGDRDLSDTKQFDEWVQFLQNEGL